MRRAGLLFALLVSGFSLLSAAPAGAAENEGSVLFVAPQRLVLGPADRVGVLNVENRSTQERRYDISIIEQVMGPDGVTQRADKAPYSIKSMVHYVPRRFSLKPAERQTVRIALSRPAGLADGDYHSHMMFREVPLEQPKDKPAPDAPAADKPDGRTVTFDIQTLYGLGVPIVVQQGKIVSDMDLGEAKPGMAPDGKLHQVAVDFARSGNAEAVAKLKIDYVQDGKSPVPATTPQWIHMYHEVDKITKSIVLNTLPPDARDGKLVISLIRDEKDDSKTIRKEIPFQ
jgi:fimbrial chaperone protein